MVWSHYVRQKMSGDINHTLTRSGADRNADQRTWLLGSRPYLPKKWTDEDESVYNSHQEREQYAQRIADAALPTDSPPAQVRDCG